MRALWTLPKAAPAVLRHLAAYAELAALDFTRAQREIGSVFIATVVAAVCGLFCLALGCLVVIAYYWDTPYRIMVIGCLAGGFLLVALGMLIYTNKLSRARTPFLADFRREWREDKLILERVLSDEE